MVWWRSKKDFKKATEEEKKNSVNFQAYLI